MPALTWRWTTSLISGFNFIYLTTDYGNPPIYGNSYLYHGSNWVSIDGIPLTAGVAYNWSVTVYNPAGTGGYSLQFTNSSFNSPFFTVGTGISQYGAATFTGRYIATSTTGYFPQFLPDSQNIYYNQNIYINATFTSIDPPNSPTGVSALVNSSNGLLTISYTAPSNNGGATITSYRFSLNNGTDWIDTGSTSNPLTYTPSIFYTSNQLILQAYNVSGWGSSSTPSYNFSLTVPSGQPSLTGASVDTSGALTVSGNVGTLLGTNLPILGYNYSVSGSGGPFYYGTTNKVFPLTFTGVTYSSSNTISIQGYNAVGGSAGSSNNTVIITAPAAIGSISQFYFSNSTRTNTVLTIIFTTPSTNQASISGYVYSLDNTAPTTSASSSTVDGVGNTIVTISNSNPYLMGLYLSSSLQLSAVNYIGTATPPIVYPYTIVNDPPTIISVNLSTTNTLTIIATVSSTNTIPVLYNVVFQVNSTTGPWRGVNTITGDSTATATGTPSSTIVRGDTASNIIYIQSAIRFADGTSSNFSVASAGSSAITAPSAISSITTFSFSSSTTSTVILTITFPTPNKNNADIINYVYSLNNTTPTNSCSGTVNGANTTITLTSPIGLSTSSYLQLSAVNYIGKATPIIYGYTVNSPTVPQNVTASISNSSGTLVITSSPSTSSMLPLTGYRYYWNGNVYSAGTPTGTTTLTFTITGVPFAANISSSNAIYLVAYNAFNSSSASNSITIAIPDGPVITSISVDQNTGALSVYYTAGSNNNASIYNYRVYLNDTPTVIGNTNNPLVYTPGSYLSNNTIYIQAQNYIGWGTSSNTATYTLGAPYSPTLNTASVNSSGNLSFSFTAPNNGGSPITNYDYSINNGTSYTLLNSTNTSYTINVSQLTYTSSNTVLVRAINNIGTGIASNGITITRPDPPTINSVSVDSNTGALSVYYTAGSSNNATIYNYRVYLNGTPTVIGNTNNPLVYTPSSYLTNNTIYIQSQNYIDWSTSSNTTNYTLSAPSSPTLNTAIVSALGNLSFSFTAPSNNGGSPITNYQYSINNGTSYTLLNSTNTSYTISAGQLSYTSSNVVVVQAINNVGTGTVSNSITISTPSAATINSASVATTGTLTITFTPGSTNNTTLSNYQYTLNGVNNFIPISPAQTGSGSGPTYTLTINNITSYVQTSLVIQPISYIGAGPSSNTYTITGLSVPSAPGIISQYDSLNLANTINLVITPPSNTGGLAVTNYRYSLDNGTTWTTFSPAQNGTTTLVVMGGPPQTVNNVLVIGGLTERATYSLIIQAINLVGLSPQSNMLYFKFMCFLEGTKILCYDATTQQEVYRCVETLQKGDLVKTLTSGYKAVDTIGTSKIYNPGNKMRSDNRLYQYSKNAYPSLFEDLVITGCHSILVDGMPKQEMMELIDLQGKIYMTEGKCRLTARVDRRASTYEHEGLFNIWHFALENSDYYGNYGVYANGLLVETSSKRMMNECSGMNLIK